MEAPSAVSTPYAYQPAARSFSHSEPTVQHDKELQSALQDLARVRSIHQDRPHSAVAQALHGVGVRLLRSGRVFDAFNYHNEALELQGKLHQGRAHPALIQSLACVAGCLTRMARVSEKPHEALTHHSKALNMRLSIYQERFARPHQNKSLTEDFQDVRVAFELTQSKFEVALALDRLNRHRESTVYWREGCDLRRWVATRFEKLSTEYPHAQAVIRKSKDSLQLSDLSLEATKYDIKLLTSQEGTETLHQLLRGIHEHRWSNKQSTGRWVIGNEWTAQNPLAYAYVSNNSIELHGLLIGNLELLRIMRMCKIQLLKKVTIINCQWISDTGITQLASKDKF